LQIKRPLTVEECRVKKNDGKFSNDGYDVKDEGQKNEYEDGRNG